MSRRIRWAPCMSGMGAAPSLATHSPICWFSPVTKSPGNITSTTRVPKSMFGKVRLSALPGGAGRSRGEIPEGRYPGDYLKSVGAALAEKYGRQWLGAARSRMADRVRGHAIETMMAMIRTDLACLNIEHEVFFSERSLTHGDGGDLVAGAIAALRKLGLVYEGRLPPPKGEPAEDWRIASRLCSNRRTLATTPTGL